MAPRIDDHLISHTVKPSAVAVTPVRHRLDGSDPPYKRSRYDVHTDLNAAAMSLVKLATTTAATHAAELSSATPPPRTNTYTCNTCGKIFTTYQALGGHKSSHRVKPSAAVRDVIYYYRDIIGRDGSGKRLHECKVCNKAFPTGQALGGHKRKHFEGVIGGGGGAKSRNSSNTNSGVTVDGCAASLTKAAVVRDFDLNFPPVELNCDEEAESSLPP